MGIFRKQTVRAPWTTVLLILLLALSIAASSIGFAAWTGARQQFEAIDRQYTTIAIPSGLNQEKLYQAGSYRPIGFDSKEFEDGSRYYGPFDCETTAKGSEYYKGSDQRIYLSAYVEGGVPLSSGTLDPLEYNYALDNYCYQVSVMAVRCISIETFKYDWKPNKEYWGCFEIVDDVCRIDAYDLPPYEDVLYFGGGIYTRDGEIPFEVGKTYLVRGLYWDYDVIEEMEWVTNEDGVEQLKYVPTRALNGEFDSKRKLLVEPMYPFHYGLGPGVETGVTSGLPNWVMEWVKNPETGEYYYTTPEENCWPYFTEYQGDWRDFLETEEGRVWKEEIIPNFEMNHSSVPVILTDDVNSLYAFNSGDVSILEGSSFTEEDQRSGNKVCLISAAYAKLNGLSVGDTINLDYHKTTYEATKYPLSYISGRAGMTIRRLPLTWNTRIDVQQDYTIVGIYTGPNWPNGNHGIHADTILVPKASVPDADKYAGPSLPLLNTVIIENGSIDAFEAHMAANDKAGAYLYFDQGYSEAAATVQTLIDNAMRLMVVGVAMFLLASMLFLLLYARRVAAVMRSMRLLGVPKKGVWLESLGILIAQELTAVLLGNALAVTLYARITAQLLSGTPALELSAVILCGGVQLALLVITGGLWTRSIAGSNLMQRTAAPRLRPLARTA